MKASELVALLVRAITEYGDLPVLVRCPENGYSWSDLTVAPDPPSALETMQGVEGTIDITVCG